MRHRKSHNHLSRKAGHRKSLLRNLSISLIEHKRISTTLAKAKALRPFIEPILTTSKANTMHARRTAFRLLQNKEAIKELFATVAPAIAERPGGYVRIIRTGTRLGDNAETALIELVDFNPDYNPKKEATGGRRRRRRRRGGSGSNADTSSTADPAAASSEPDASEATASAGTASGQIDDADAAEQVTDVEQEATVQGTTPEGLTEPAEDVAEIQGRADESADTDETDDATTDSEEDPKVA